MLNFANKPKNLPPIPPSQGGIEKNNIFERKPLGPNNSQLNDSRPPIPPQNMMPLKGNQENMNNENLPPTDQKKDRIKKERKQGIRKNITDSKVILPNDISQEDRVGEDFSADAKDDTVAMLLKEKSNKSASFKEDLKTGKFLPISNKLVESIMDGSKEEMKLHEGVVDEDSKWYKLIDDFNSMIFRFVFLLQGLLAGLLIMIAVTSFSANWSSDTYRYRLNQIIWIISLFCFFGQIYIYMVCSQRCDYSFTNGSLNYGDNKNSKLRALFNLFIYGIVYYCVMVCHYYVSMLTYTAQVQDNVVVGSAEENGFSYLITISAIFSFFGWFIVGNQTKSNYIEMEYDDDDMTKPGDDSDEEI